jgi:hypothetical protein
MNCGLIFVCCFFGGVALMCFVIWKVMDFIDKRNDSKHHKEHPEYFRLWDDFDEKINTAGHFYNTEITPRKRKVKAMLEEEPYWPREVREQKMEEVEKLRREIYTAECMYKGLDKETEEARKKVADYVRAHNIKWAGDWN